MKKILLGLLLLCSNAFAAITDGKFGINQIFDVQYYWSGNTLNASSFIAPYNKNFQTVTATSGQYFQFFASTTNPGKYGLGLYNGNGTLAQVVHDYGDITALGSGAVFYIGSGFFGNVITTEQGYSYGASAQFTNMDTSVSSSDLSSYTFASSTPLAAGQTAPPPAPTNIGFESGNTTSWTISNTTGAADWNSGSGAAVVNGLQHTPGSGKSWTVTPYGSYMLSIQAGGGSPTFDSMTTSLGLTAAQNTAIKNLLIQQAQTGGGDPTPTNAAWVKRDVTLKAGVTYTIAWQYLSTDYTPFNDGSIITLVSKTDSTKVPTLNNAVRNYALLGFTNPGTGDYSTSSYGATGWQIATYTVPADGDYILGFASFNLGDTALSPILLIDEQPGTTLLNGAPFTSVEPNAGSGAPSPSSGGGGGSSAPTWPADSDITAAQSAQKAAAKSRVASIQLGNYVYIDQKIGSSSNAVTIEQTGNYNKVAGLGGATYAVLDGDNNTINIKQGDTIGKNLIEFSVTGNANNISVWQARNPTTGLQDGSESGGHYFGLNINGSTNTLSIKQSNDGGTTSGHFAYVDVTGSNNQGTLKQSGNGENTFFGVINGNTNVFDVTQQGAGSYLDLSLTGNGHTVTANQKDTGSHKATINLTNVGGTSNVTLVQQGTTAQNINITQQCAALSGCSVSVTQGTGP